MRKNLVKQALAEGRFQIGTGFGQLRSAEIPKLLKAAGFDWAFIDTEHGNFDLETVQDLCRVASLVDFCPIVRVADMQYPLVARALDCGAQGIIFPRVESPEVLARAVSWAKFPPLGVRGYGLTGMQIDWETRSFAEIIEHVNANTLVAFQIETQAALDARDELLSVPNVDAVMIGPADLSISLGVPGEFQHPRMVAAIESVVESCLRHGVAPGMQTRTPSLAMFWKARGMRFLGCSNETGMLFDRGCELVKTIKG